MKITLNESEFINRFMAIRPNQFSREALVALFDYLDKLEDDLGEETEFDPIAICCDWTEYASAIEGAEAYGFEPKLAVDERAERDEQDALTFLCDERQMMWNVPGDSFEERPQRQWTCFAMSTDSLKVGVHNRS